LPRAIGAFRAFEIMLTGRDVDAAEAARIGLVSLATADDELLSTCFDMAERITGWSRVGVELAKRLLWWGLDAASLEAHMRHEGVAGSRSKPRTSTPRRAASTTGWAAALAPSTALLIPICRPRCSCCGGRRCERRGDDFCVVGQSYPASTARVFAHAKGDPFGATTHRFRRSDPRVCGRNARTIGHPNIMRGLLGRLRGRW
jgi:Enoyl-CoA hydratase/isomerase